ncbi:MAG TPA: phosphodiester glycosidase family protein [Acidimicrobiales bacterium]|nr:phosphodiester glycosidase family protein [Acidimicrobiales bacterium]
MAVTMRRMRRVRGGPGRAEHRPRGRRAVVVAAAAVALLAASMASIAATPGNQGAEAKWADWLRSHDGAALVNPIERWYYAMQAPDAGGHPHSLATVPRPRALPPGTVPPPTIRRPSLPAPVPLVVPPALPGEGQWRPTGPVVDGRPTMEVAQYRADTVYTSQLTSAVWIDPSVLRVRLVPGSQEPGGAWPVAPDLAGATAARAVAAFNGGFRFQDAHGGFYLDGRTAVPLRTGAASVVISRDGSIGIGSWGSEVTMTSRVEAVLQNLVLLVDHGRLTPAAAGGDPALWGATLGASPVVARSGIGVTASGALLYVAGPALTARSLADALQRAGAVRAMTLDMNPEWVTCNFFTHPDRAHPASVVATKLYPQMQRPATRYLGPTPESRDFFSVSTR